MLKFWNMRASMVGSSFLTTFIPCPLQLLSALRTANPCVVCFWLIKLPTWARSLITCYLFGLPVKLRNGATGFSTCHFEFLVLSKHRVTDTNSLTETGHLGSCKEPKPI